MPTFRVYTPEGAYLSWHRTELSAIRKVALHSIDHGAGSYIVRHGEDTYKLDMPILTGK